MTKPVGTEVVPVVKNHRNTLRYIPNFKSILLIFLNSIAIKHTTKISKKNAELRLNQSNSDLNRVLFRLNFVLNDHVEKLFQN